MVFKFELNLAHSLSDLTVTKLFFTATAAVALSIGAIQCALLFPEMILQSYALVVVEEVLLHTPHTLYYHPKCFYYMLLH